MRANAPTQTTGCPKCGSRLAAGTCPACALGGLLSGGGSLEDYEDVTARAVSLPQEAGEVAFGRYTLKKRIAAGGMGVVYLAEDRKLKRTVALKMIRGSSFANESEVARFRLEAEAAAALDHPNIVPIYEIGQLEGQPFFTMKQIEGGSLAQRLKATGGSLPQKEVAALLCRIARAVHHAHQRGVLHRDLKPGNILLDGNGVPWLTDFGLAKLAHAESDLTLSSDHIGTPDYMSPEIVAGKTGEVSTACDVWALGVLLWEMLYGVKPFHGATTVETMRRVAEEEPSLPREVRGDEDLTTLARRCMEKDPARRPESAGEVAEELERWMRGEPILARRVSPGERFLKWVRRSRPLAALYAVLAIGGISSLFLWQRAEKAVVSLTETNEQLGAALRISTATKLAVDARLQIPEDPARALLLAVESVELTERNGGGILTEAVEALHEVLQHASGKDVSPLGPKVGGANDGYVDRGITTILPVEMSPDGSRMVTVDYSQVQQWGVTAAMFDPRNHTSDRPLLRWRLLPEFTGVNAWMWLGDSRHLASLAGGGKIRVWDLGLPEQASPGEAPDHTPPSRVIGDLALPGYVLRAVRFRRGDAQRSLAGTAVYVDESGNDNGEPVNGYCARFAVNPESGEPVTVSRLLALPPGYGKGVDYQFSPDGRWLIAAPLDWLGRSCLIDMQATGEENHAFVLPEKPQSWTFPEFSPGGGFLAMVVDQSILRIFDLRSGVGETIVQSGRELLRCRESIDCLEFSGDDRYLAVGTNGGEIAVATTGETAPTRSVRLEGASALGLAFSPDAKWLAAGGADKTVSVWPIGDLETAPFPLRFRGLTTAILGIRFSPGQESIIGTGMHCAYRQWEFNPSHSGAEPVTLEGNRDYINDLAVSPDGDWIATACGNPGLSGEGGSEGTVKLTGVRGGKEFRLGRHARRATGVAFSPDGRWLASAGRDGLARVWDYAALITAIRQEKALPEPLHVLDMTDTRLNYDRRLAFHPRGTLYATCGDGVLFEWDLNDSDPDAGRLFHDVHSIRYHLPDVSVSRDGRWMAVCRHGWDWTPKEGSRQVGNMVLLFDVSSPGAPIPVTELPAHFLEKTNVDFSPDGRWLASGGAGLGTTVWDLGAADIAASRVVSEASSHWMAGVAFSPDGQYLGLGGSDGRLHLWNWRNGSQSRTITTGDSAESVAWLGESKLVSGGRRGVVALWEMNTKALKENARKVAGRELSDEERRRFRIGE